MADFSTTSKRGDFCAPCQQANLFAAHFPQGGPTLEGSVGGLSTPIALGGSICPLQNSLDGTTGSLSIKVNGENKTIIDDLSQFRISKPQDVGVIIQDLSPTPEKQPYSPKGRLMEYAIQTTSQSESEDVLVIEIAENSVPEGDYDVDMIDEILSYRISNALLNGLELFDQMTRADDLLNWSQQNLKIGDMPLLIDFTLTGTDGPPVIAEIIATISYNRQFLLEAVNRQSRKIKVWKSGAGKLLLSFRYSQPARGLFQGLIVGVTRNRLVQISAGATQTLRPLSDNVAKKLPLIGLFIVASIEVTEYFATEPSKRELTSLFAALFVELGSVIIGGIVGGMLAAGAIVGFAITAPLAIIAAGIGAAIVVGIIITSTASYLGLESKVKNVLDDFAQGFETVIQDFEQNSRSFYEDIYTPIDWGMDLDRGIRKHVDNRVQNYLNNMMINLR